MDMKNEVAHVSDNGVVDLCDSDDNEDVDIVTEHVSVKMEANTKTSLAIVTPSSSKKRKLVNQEIEEEQIVRNERKLKKEEDEANTESPHGVGTIIRKWFDIDGNYYEGEVTSYDPISRYYKIKYTDGDEEDFDEEDMNQYIKQNQWYSRTTCDFTAGRSQDSVLQPSTVQSSPSSLSTSQDDNRRTIKDEIRIIPETPSSASSPEVKREMAEQKRMAAYRDAREIYGDRAFLHRFNGIGRLGGSHQNTFVQPCKGNQKVWNGNKLRPEYPLHKMALKNNNDDEDDVYDMDAFCYLGFNGLWQVNGPNFATQPTAAVNYVPSFMKKKDFAIPIFMKRSLTRKSDKRERKILGWEYVGNYRCISDEDLVVWDSADNFPEACKREIVSKTLRSADSQSEETHGRQRLDFWREELKKWVEEGDNDKDTKQALDLGFKSDMSDEDLMNLIVELDRFYGQEIIEFVEYDERIYEYCSKGLTSKNSKGEILAKYGGDIAKASDWYDFADEHMLM